MVNKNCLVLLFGSIHQYFMFLQTATCFTCISILKITLFKTTHCVGQHQPVSDVHM